MIVRHEIKNNIEELVFRDYVIKQLINKQEA
jgi:hypothetical protein